MRQMDSRGGIHEVISAEDEACFRDKWSYPNVVSQRLLGKVADKHVVDLGAGSSPALGQWVKRNGGHYIAVDVNKKYLRSLQTAGLETLQGNIIDLPPTSKLGRADIVHVRFVLAHLESQQCEQGILEPLRVGLEQVIFMELDWTPFGGPEPVNNFVHLARRSTPFRMDFTLASRLEAEVRKLALGAPCVIQPHVDRRDPGPYYDEVVGLAENFRTVARTVFANDPARVEVLAEYDEAVRLLQEEAAKPNPEPFQPPDIVIVEVLKNHGLS